MSQSFFANSIGVCGIGVVGGAIVRGMEEYVREVRSYDIDHRRRTHTLHDTLQSDFVFVCLPTPMKESGVCDTGIIDDFFQSIDPAQYPNTRFVLKSTLPVGTVRRIGKRFPRIVHSPEFLTARCASTDFNCPSRNVIGDNGNIESQDTADALNDLYAKRFPGTAILRMTSEESELVKLTCNSFFAVKLSFFNEIYALCEKLCLSFDRITEGVLSDGRIGNSHFRVPGPPDSSGRILRGWGSRCLPKDLNDLINCFNQQGIDTNVLPAAWKTNLQVRQVRDWESDPSAFTKKHNA